MKTFKVVAVVIGTLAILTATVFFLVSYFKPKPAGIRIDTNPPSSVFINGELVGTTPLRKTFPAGAVILKLVPNDAAGNLLPYEIKITLVSGIETVVRREFGPTEDASSGDVLTFIKSGDGATGLVVISTPDNAQVSLDGVARGFAPYKSARITPGEHQITVKSPGYADRIMTVNTLHNYQLTVFAKLAKAAPAASDEASSATPAPTHTTYVVIQNTPTGYLRVRTEPGAGGDEIAQVKPGDKYLYLDTDSATGWYKIQYEGVQPGLPAGITGWVSNQYAQISTESGILQ